MAYIDLNAAFDSVDRASLWKTLQGSGILPLLLHLIRDLHTGTTARVRTQTGFSAPFHTTSGVRQGCNLAPDLFCNTADWLMEKCINPGVNIGNSIFTDIDCADDAVLFAEDSGL